MKGGVLAKVSGPPPPDAAWVRLSGGDELDERSVRPDRGALGAAGLSRQRDRAAARAVRGHEGDGRDAALRAGSVGDKRIGPAAVHDRHRLGACGAPRWGGFHLGALHWLCANTRATDIARLPEWLTVFLAL